MDIEQLRSICLSFPGTSEAVKYDDQLAFMVLGKHFCSSRLPDLNTINLKVPDD
ncbi:MAG: MmcQ/YjbR family DNA-binding protein [Saprospiraceae bacterium]|nr:MmcQ/YjbR family DNA-binding protein [Saprospiraceae bacterium]MCF8249792.1 MmcQ/YjbR family DNA-binding protein [Saprospiraceae bacterium]MCF8279277.1 MmcQ/YjbR family DNA-binding protein [Bacteroidales bacterium]MCF8313457.1 MmcQ/YjbR family DNA-binding protein [Saprospiraceae bacterium]MCF8442170.1 MmcQ/YjbR family DNA-binding protein [Saprospiraceae bacterium]